MKYQAWYCQTFSRVGTSLKELTLFIIVSHFSTLLIFRGVLCFLSVLYLHQMFLYIFVTYLILRGQICPLLQRYYPCNPFSLSYTINKTKCY